MNTGMQMTLIHLKGIGCWRSSTYSKDLSFGSRIYMLDCHWIHLTWVCTSTHCSNHWTHHEAIASRETAATATMAKIQGIATYQDTGEGGGGEMHVGIIKPPFIFGTMTVISPWLRGTWATWINMTQTWVAKGLHVNWITPINTSNHTSIVIERIIYIKSLPRICHGQMNSIKIWRKWATSACMVESPRCICSPGTNNTRGRCSWMDVNERH